ncbi:unnamed protein product [Schistosoma mattheei]|uniref:Uncharacterized protein n=1 Tax=Schistosoma mattheei TaxID=31246 RepID=A0A183PBJ0_9TREM|nr:unnamed protein product [Schistosoma mattheei]
MNLSCCLVNNNSTRNVLLNTYSLLTNSLKYNLILGPKTTSVAATSAAVGLNIHKGKSKILRHNTACTNPITSDEDSEDVKTFTYLDSIIDEEGGSDADVKAWIGKARVVYLQLKDI